MCSGPLWNKILLFALPLMASSMLQLLFNAADIVVVGRFAGTEALAAVGSNTSLINLMINLFVGLSVGTNVVVARDLGAGRNDNVRRSVHTSVALALLSGVVMMIFGVVMVRRLLVWMSSPTDVIDLATVYLRIYFFGMPANIFYNFGAAILRAQGDTRRPLYYLTTAGVINVALNLFFVVVLHMDVAGVGLATVISQYVSALLVLRCLMREQGPLHLDLKKLRLEWPVVRRILEVGLPAGFQGVLFSLSNVVIQSSINTFGETVVAGNSAASSVEGFLYVSVNAFHQANISFTSQNYGAGHYRRIWRVFFLSTACAMAVGGVLGGLVVMIGPALLQLYTTSAAVIAAGMVRLRITCFAYSIGSMMDATVGTVRGLGYSVLPTIVTLIGACALRLVWIATVFQIPQYHTIATIYWSYPITWLLTSLAHCVCVVLIMRRLKGQLNPES